MKTNLKAVSFVVVIVGIALFSIGCNENKTHKDMVALDNTLLFPKGEKLSNKWFVGDAFLQPLVSRDKNNDFVVGSVSFEPGARTNWHTHPKGQVLIVTEGEGIYQEKGKAAQEIKKGDVVTIPEKVKHWHGATAQSKMIHIAITNYQGEENVTWLDPVTEQEFSQANK